ncbi:hypothetical protein GE061_009126 [Apolygus lucorum]|uniref:Uncharacterized protein n=1 Tax=Apolygus lucorum TaxID=248454 RepID=A0A6A4JRZ8_APOLU|nr:hypothetical protein GE061_009126 [Apolygus lucorum]
MALRFVCKLINVKSKFWNQQLPGLDFRSSESKLICSSSQLSVGEGEVTKKTHEPPSSRQLPEEPTNCCMSGCANCVWIKYAEDLIKQFDGGSDLARKMILEKVEDPNMRAFLEMELRTLTNR